MRLYVWHVSYVLYMHKWCAHTHAHARTHTQVCTVCISPFLIVATLMSGLSTVVACCGLIKCVLYTHRCHSIDTVASVVWRANYAWGRLREVRYSTGKSSVCSMLKWTIRAVCSYVCAVILLEAALCALLDWWSLVHGLPSLTCSVPGLLAGPSVASCDWMDPLITHRTGSMHKQYYLNMRTCITHKTTCLLHAQCYICV